MTIVLAFIFGLCIGSFLNVLIWRLPLDQRINGRSQCPKCKHTLAWHDLLPLLSFASSRGRCRYCKANISFRYPLIETITGFLFALAMFHFAPTDLLGYFVLAQAVVAIAVCIAVFVIDLEHYLILDKIVFPAMGIVVLLLAAQCWLTGDWSLLTGHIIAGFLAMIPFLLIWAFSKGAWMGLGDVKFVAFMGLTLGWPAIAAALLMAFASGAVVGVALLSVGSKKLSSQLPFGTFLAIATVLAIFFGQAVWDGYWHILGL